MQVAPAEEKEAEKKPVSEQAAPVSFEDHDTYKFSVSLPSGWKMEEMWEGSLDFCDYEVKAKDGTKILELHALLNSRFDAGSITDLYAAALESSKLEIIYKLQKQNWFVISGIDKKTKNIVYWKRIWGEHYVSDLYLDYPKNKETEIAPYIGRIAKSFISE